MIDLAALRLEATKVHDEPVEWGRFLACDAALQAAGEPPVPQLIRDEYLSFLRSGAGTFCAGMGQRSTKSTSMLRLCTLPEILLSPYVTSAGATPIWPIVSANMQEASERIRNLEHFFKQLGYTELPRRPKTAEKIGLSKGQFVVVGGLELHLLDGCENPMIVRVTARELGAVSGFTGRGSALCDEVSLWDHGENSGRIPVTEPILETLVGRGARQGRTKLLLVSRLFSPDDALSARCREGSTADRYVATLGERGAEMDFRGRRWLSRYYQGEALRAKLAQKRSLYSDLADDPRLHEPPTPGAYAISSWAAFPDGPEIAGAPTTFDAPESPERAIAECRRLSAQATRAERDILDGLFRAYGSRGHASGSYAWIHRASVEAIRPDDRGRSGHTLAELLDTMSDHDR